MNHLNLTPAQSYRINSEYSGIRMRKTRDNLILFNIYRIYKFIFYIPFFAFMTTLCGLGGALFSVIFNETIGNMLPIVWGRLNILAIPAFVKVEGKQNVEKKQSYIVVANHISQADTFLIYGWLPVDFRWVMKSELRKVPVLGYSCCKMGHVFVDRTNIESAKKSIDAAKKKLKNGTCIMFFAEGARSVDGRLLDFKKGAFKTALEMQLPILPVTIAGTQHILPAGTIALFPGKTKMIIHQPVSVENYNDDNIHELIDKTKNIIQSGLDANPEYN